MILRVFLLFLLTSLVLTHPQTENDQDDTGNDITGRLAGLRTKRVVILGNYVKMIRAGQAASATWRGLRALRSLTNGASRFPSPDEYTSMFWKSGGSRKAFEDFYKLAARSKQHREVTPDGEITAVGDMTFRLRHGETPTITAQKTAGTTHAAEREDTLKTVIRYYQ